MVQANPLFPIKNNFPNLEKNINVDVAIAGGGIAGISSAYHLSKKGYTVAVLEEQEIGSGATGASSGILYYGSGTDFTNALSLFGKEKATMLWKETEKTIETIEELVNKNSISCGFRKPGAIIAAKNDKERIYLETELKNLKSAGFDGRLLEANEIKEHFSLRTFYAGLMQDFVCQIYPGAFAAELAKLEELPVYNNSPLIEYTEGKDSVSIKTPKAQVTAQKLIFATNRKPFFGLDKYFSIENSVILATKKLSEQQLRKIWPKHKIIWTMEDKYDIIYEHDSRAVLELYYFKGAREKIKNYFGNFEFSQEFTWGDSWSKTSDWKPIVGQIKEKLYASIAMGDQGIVLGFTSGKNIVDLIEGRNNSFLDMTNPKRFVV